MLAAVLRVPRRERVYNRIMNYNIKGTGLEITPELREYVETRLEHAQKFLGEDSTALAQVELEHSPARDGGKYRAEFTVSASGEVFRSEEWASGMHEAIDLALGDLARELRRNKKKRLHNVRHAAVRVKEYLRGWRKSI